MVTSRATLPFLFAALVLLTGCPEDCDDICDCVSAFVRDNPDANNGGTVCKPSCEAQVNDHDSCRDFISGRVTDDYVLDIQQECASQYCDSIEGGGDGEVPH